MSFNTYPSNPFPPNSEEMGEGGGGQYVLPVASAETLGGVKVGANLSIADGVLSAGAPYSLPTASAETLGGVKVGANLSIADGVLSASGANYSLTEHEVGTWLDGKTLYERTFNIFSNGEAQYPVANSEYDIALTGTDTAFIYSVVGERVATGASQYIDWGNAPSELITVLNKSAGKVYINPKSHTYENFYVTIRYTKTGV